MPFQHSMYGGRCWHLCENLKSSMMMTRWWHHHPCGDNMTMIWKYEDDAPAIWCPAHPPDGPTWTGTSHTGPQHSRPTPANKPQCNFIFRLLYFFGFTFLYILYICVRLPSLSIDVIYSFCLIFVKDPVNIPLKFKGKAKNWWNCNKRTWTMVGPCKKHFKKSQR